MSFLADVDADTVLFSKAESKLRWPVLVFVCLSLIGSFYTYDEPAALKTQIGDYMGDPANYETLFSLLYSVYSFPNMVLPFFGGYLVDRFKARNCQVLFSFLALVGNIVFAVGMSTKLWGVMYLGRIIHGCGGISICISALALLAEWFTGKELALAFGCELSVCRLAGVMSNLVNPRLVDIKNVESAIWLGVLLCAVSLVSAFAIHPMDEFLELQVQLCDHDCQQDDERPCRGQGFMQEEQDDVHDEQPRNQSGKMHARSQTDAVSNPIRNIKYSNVALTSVDRDAVIEMQPVTTTISENHLRSSSTSGNSGACTSGYWTVEHQLSIVHTFSPLFWLLCLSCVCVYGCVFPFNNIASTLLLERNYFMEQPNGACALTYDSSGACQNSTNVPNEYCNNGQWYQPPVAQGAEVNCDHNPACYRVYCDGLDRAEIQAASIMSIPYIITASLCPFFGSLCDRYGQRATMLLVAPSMLCLVHILIGFSDVDIVILLIGQGLSYCAFAAVMWPSISLVLQPENYGLGYGFVFVIQNIGTACVPLVVAEIYEQSGNTYIPNVELIFVCLAGIASCGGFYMCIYDYHHSGIFNSPSGRPVNNDTVSRTNDSSGGVDCNKSSIESVTVSGYGSGSSAKYNMVGTECDQSCNQYNEDR